MSSPLSVEQQMILVSMWRAAERAEKSGLMAEVQALCASTRTPSDMLEALAEAVQLWVIDVESEERPQQDSDETAQSAHDLVRLQDSRSNSSSNGETQQIKQALETVMRAVVRAGQEAGITRSDLNSASTGDCLQILDALSKSARLMKARTAP